MPQAAAKRRVASGGEAHIVIGEDHLRRNTVHIPRLMNTSQIAERLVGRAILHDDKLDASPLRMARDTLDTAPQIILFFERYRVHREGVGVRLTQPRWRIAR